MGKDVVAVREKTTPCRGCTETRLIPLPGNSSEACEPRRSAGGTGRRRPGVPIKLPRASGVVILPRVGLCRLLRLRCCRALACTLSDESWWTDDEMRLDGRRVATAAKGMLRKAGAISMLLNGGRGAGPVRSAPRRRHLPQHLLVARLEELQSMPCASLELPRPHRKEWQFTQAALRGKCRCRAPSITAQRLVPGIAE